MSQPLIRLGTLRHAGLRSKAESKVASSHESMLDLFTLISFIMIIAAFAGVNHFVKQGQQTSSIVVQIAKRGSGTPTTLPKDTLLLVIHRSDSINKLTVFGARHPTPEVVDITVDNLQQTLLRMEDELKNVPVLKIAIYEEKLEVNPGILIAVQKWFASHRHKRYDLTFVGPE